MRRRSVFVDLTPFRLSPRFRLLWGGYLVTMLGNQLTVVAVPFQVYTLTHSSFDVGLVSLVQLGPLLVGSLWGGALADVFDRRRILLASQACLCSTSVGLALNTTGGKPALWPLFVCSAAAAGFSGVDSPTRAALSSELVDRSAIVSANALWQLLYTVGAVVGPAIAGVLIGRVGVVAVYWIDAASYFVALASLLALHTAREPGPGPSVGVTEILGGLAFLRRNPILQGVFLIDLNAMIFGLPRAVFPALGLSHFHGGAGTVGALYAAPGAGALLGALLTGWISSVRRQGRAVLLAVIAWGVSITLFGLVHVLWIALGLLGLAGASDIVSAVFRAALVQLLSPESLRGRMQALNTAVVTGGPRLGDVESGAVAAIAGPVTAVVSGGIVCLAGVALLAWVLPDFRRASVGTGANDAALAEDPPTDVQR